MKYRISQKLETSRYIIERRFLFIWWPILNWLGNERLFSTLTEAKYYIKAEKLKGKKKIIEYID